MAFKTLSRDLSSWAREQAVRKASLELSEKSAATRTLRNSGMVSLLPSG